jgi:hypothetical protein
MHKKHFFKSGICRIAYSNHNALGSNDPQISMYAEKYQANMDIGMEKV